MVAPAWPDGQGKAFETGDVHRKSAERLGVGTESEVLYEMLRCALPYLQHTQPPISSGGNAGLDGVRTVPAGGESIGLPWLQI